MPAAARPEDVQAAFCATLVDEWIRGGVTHAVVSPGSRSTPLTLAIAAREALSMHVVLDERSAAFVALGIGKATGHPAVLVCTSGTAAANHLPAVVEAGLCGVPMVVCTADRPPELRDVGAPQTIDQTRLFGTAVRWFHDPGVPDTAASGHWRALGARSLHEASGPAGAGPVHLNLAFREPLMGDARAGGIPAGRTEGARWSAGPPQSSAADVGAAVGLLRRGVVRGLVVAGEGATPEVVDLAAALGWPVLADALSGLRGPRTVAAFDGIVRARTAALGDPTVVLRVGRPPASKVLAAFLGEAAAAGVASVVVVPAGAWVDPDATASVVMRGDVARTVGALAAALAGTHAEAGWREAWMAADVAAQRAIDALSATAGPLTEPAVARGLAENLPDGACLFVSSSMPIRDVEWFGPRREHVRVLANRGANGIDGVPSTALGVALALHPTPVACLIGDLALLHDGSGLCGMAARRANMVLVIVDNGGGGIFSFLPQATALDPDRFAALFATSQPTDIPGLLTAHGIPVVEVRTTGELAGEVTTAAAIGGVRAIIVRTDRAANVRDHDALHDAIAAALHEPQNGSAA